MKAENQNRGFFRAAVDALTRNWWLKLLSVVLAIIIYHSLKTENATPKDPHDTSLFQYR